MWGALKDSLQEDAHSPGYGLLHILALVSVVVFLGLSVFSVVSSRDHHFEASDFGLGLGSVLVAAGTAIGLKAKLGG